MEHTLSIWTETPQAHAAAGTVPRRTRPRQRLAALLAILTITGGNVIPAIANAASDVPTGPAPWNAPTVEPASASATSTWYQESSSQIVFGGSWTGASSSTYRGGQAVVSKVRGSSASLTSTGTGFAWMGTKGPTRGQAKIYLDGRYVRTVNTYASRLSSSQVLYSASFSNLRARTFKIVVVGTAGRPAILIDALVSRRGTTSTNPGPAPAPGTFPGQTTLKSLATTSLPRPGYLGSVLDRSLGTTTTRISNAGVRQNYSRISAWNSDGSKILLGFSYPGRMLDGRTYRDLGSFSQISGAIWSNTNPNKLYGVDSQGNGNRLYSQNATTGALSVIRAFTSFSYITIGDGEGGVSDDDRFIVLFGYPSSGAKHIIVFDLTSRTVVADKVAPSGTDNAQISRKGNYVVVVGSTTRRYTRSLASSIQLYPYGNHGDNALDASGREIYVTNNAPGVKSFRLSDGAGTLLLGGTTAFEYGHVSGRNIDRPGWIYLSVYNNTITAGRPGRDQLIAVKTDGSRTVEVFGFSHHTNTTTYAMQPHAVPAPDGRKVLFASEWGGSAAYAFVVGR
jgi:hypothetical protein